MLRAFFAAMTAVTLVLGPAAGASLDDADPKAGADEDALEDSAYAAQIEHAQEIHRRGAARFDTADYLGAIELWTEAYGEVPDVPQAASIKAHILYNVGAAREKEFDVHGDVAQLKQARIVFDGFADIIDQLYPDPEEAAAERTRVEERIAALDVRIAEAEGRSESASESTTEGSSPVAPTGTPGDTSGSDPKADRPPPKPGRGLVIGGGVLLGVGAAGLGLMAGGMVMGNGANDLGDLDDQQKSEREDQFDRGRTGNTLAIAGGVVGGVTLAAGAVLLGIGLAKGKRGTVALRPGPGDLGLSLSGRF